MATEFSKGNKFFRWYQDGYKNLGGGGLKGSQPAYLEVVRILKNNGMFPNGEELENKTSVDFVEGIATLFEHESKEAEAFLKELKQLKDEKDAAEKARK